MSPLPGRFCPTCDHHVSHHGTGGCIVGSQTCAPCDCKSTFAQACEAALAEEGRERALANPDRIKVADTQVGGGHYRETDLQPWDVIDAWQLGFYAGNALKYLYRAGRKGPKVEDLKKARHYIDKMIEIEEGKG